MIPPTERIVAAAPGNLMLMGEHAVLHDQRAIALAVDLWVEVELTPRADRICSITSELGHYEASLDDLKASSELSFVVQAITQLKDSLPTGFNLCIRSDFSHQVGLGSSAAVTLSAVAALSAFAGLSTDATALFGRAFEVVRAVQSGKGSGTDLVASTWGGAVACFAEGREVKRLPSPPRVALHYVGYKLRTAEVIRQVETQTAQISDLVQQLYTFMGRVTERAEEAMTQENWSHTGQLMDMYAGLMDALGVCDKNLAKLQYGLRSSNGCLGAKISGSGLGDSVISLYDGEPPTVDEFQPIPISVAPRGVWVEVKQDG